MLPLVYVVVLSANLVVFTNLPVPRSSPDLWFHILSMVQ
jgi:hypothetical protein